MGFLSVSAVLLAMFLWGSSFVALKSAFLVADPWWIIWCRMAIASGAGFMLLWAFPRLCIRRSDIPLLITMGLCEPCLYFVFEAVALQYTSAAQAGAITSILPIFIGLAAVVLLGERLTKRFLIGAAIAFTGAVWLSLVSAPSIHASRPWLGNLFEVFAMISAAGYVMAVKKLSSYYHPWHLVLMQNLMGAVFFAPFAFRNIDVRQNFFSSEAPWASIIYLGLFVSLGAFLSYNYALRFLDASKAAIFTYLIPVFAAALSVLVLGEVFTIQQFTAILLILVGVFFAELTSDSKGDRVP
jgi:drug/metabolite transporter (DMT)-like permease